MIEKNILDGEDYLKTYHFVPDNSLEGAIKVEAIIDGSESELTLKPSMNLDSFLSPDKMAVSGYWFPSLKDFFRSMVQVDAKDYLILNENTLYHFNTVMYLRQSQIIHNYEKLDLDFNGTRITPISEEIYWKSLETNKFIEEIIGMDFKSYESVFDSLGLKFSMRIDDSPNVDLKTFLYKKDDNLLLYFADDAKNFYLEKDVKFKPFEVVNFYE